MTQNFLHLSPLKEEYNSEEEEEESEKKPPIKGIHSRKNSPIKDSSNKLSDKKLLSSVKKINKSPKKPRTSVKVFSQRIILNKNISSKVDLCLFALSTVPTKRNPELINYIKTYLKSMPSFMNIISKEQNNNLSENLIEQISIHLRHEFIPKNNLVCRYGEHGEKFYIILKGKVSFFIPKILKCYLNLEEYILYLMQLRMNDEFEIINNLLIENRPHFPIEDDNLDEYLINEYESYKRYLQRAHRKKTKSKTGRGNFDHNNFANNEDYDLKSNYKLNDVDVRARKRATLGTIDLTNILANQNIPHKNSKFFSYQTFKKMGVLVEKIMKESNPENNLKLTEEENTTNINPFMAGENSPKIYLKSVNVPNRELESRGRKLVSIYHYEEMTTYENGQTFGFIALQSKLSKRASTAIVVEDCDLGVLTKEEYLQFFELISSKEKKNLYELLRFYNLIISLSEYKFIKKFYHLFEFKKFYKNHNILELGKPFKELMIFSQGLFIIYINVNIPELNELITKIKMIKGKLLGLSKYKIERTLEEKRENQDLFIRKNYMSEKETKLLMKKYNFILSIISDHLILGYPDTVDPKTNLPLFNCVCTSAESDAYAVTNKSIKIINEESYVLNNLTDFCLMKMEYNLNRLKQFKKEILAKIKEKELAELTRNKTGDENIKENMNEINNKDANLNKTNYSLDKINYIHRNELDSYKYITTNKKRLFSNKLNQDKAINIITKSKNEEMKNAIEKNNRKLNSNMRNTLTILSPFNSESSQKEKDIKNNPKKIELKNIETNNTQIIPKKNYNSYNTTKIKKSLSSEAFNNNEKGLKNLNTNKEHKKMKYNSINVYNNKVKDTDINMTKSLNDKILSHLLTKNNLNLLPNIKSKKKLKNFFKENINAQSEIKKIKLDKKKQEKNINDDLYKIDQLSFVKEKFIVFKSKREQKKERFNTVNGNFLPKINKNNQNNKNHPMKITKQFFDSNSINTNNTNNINNTRDSFRKNISITRDEINNSSNIKEHEDKKNIYQRTMQSNISVKQSLMEKNMNDKYNELNILVKNLQSITKEILSKKV